MLKDPFATVDAEPVKPFDIRRERREFRKYAKKVRLFGGAKGYMRHLRTNRKHYQWVTEGYEGE